MSRVDYSMIPTCIFCSNQGIKTQVEGNQPLEACPIVTGDTGLMLSHERGTAKSFLRNTHAHFFRLPHGSERSKPDIYVFIRTNPLLGCQGESDDVIGSKSQYS